MPKQMYVLSFTGPQNYDHTKEPCLPNLDFWIFYLIIKRSGEKDNHLYVRLQPGKYRKMKSLIKMCDQIQLITEYMGFNQPAQDSRFEFDQEYINFFEFEMLAEECYQEQKK